MNALTRLQVEFLCQREPQVVAHVEPVPLEVVVALDDDQLVAFAEPVREGIKEIRMSAGNERQLPDGFERVCLEPKPVGADAEKLENLAKELRLGFRVASDLP